MPKTKNKERKRALPKEGNAGNKKKKMGNAEKRKCRKNKKAMPKNNNTKTTLYICVYIYMYIRIY